MATVEETPKTVSEPISPRSKLSISTPSTYASTSVSGSGSSLGTIASPSVASPSPLRPFHHSNIHERRLAAYVARAVPMLILISITSLTLFGAFRYLLVLEVTAAIFNLWMWLWFGTYALYTLRGIWVAKRAVGALPAPPAPSQNGVDAETSAPVVHVIVLPNYKEEESIMAETCESLAQAHESGEFRVVLAMEEREGPAAVERAQHLCDRFASCFAAMSIVIHPADLQEEHLDGSVVSEIPGKSSNLKWAVRASYEECREAGVDPADVVLTVADADCIFHPSYFAQVGGEFCEFRAAPEQQHLHTIWQAPQLPFRNYFASPAPSRIWGYIASTVEFGGVTSLASGGCHMTFSSFSLPLELVMKATPWDGDVIADDHHCFLKCFLYSIHNQACEQIQANGHCSGVHPPLRVRPIMLPVKTTSVAAQNCQKSWKARFNQVLRHAQGVAEFSYILLGAWDLLCTLPRSAYTFTLVCRLCRAVLVPFCINMLSICQAIPFAAMTVHWLLHGQQVDNCPNTIWLELHNPQFYLCVLAGGWNLVVPMALPMVLVILAGYLMIAASFLQPGEERLKLGKSDTVWHSEDGDIRPLLGSRRLALLGLILVDILVLMPVVMPVFGLIPNVRACWNIMIRGNRFEFISAAKGVQTPAPDLPRCGIQQAQADLPERLGKSFETTQGLDIV